MGVGRWESENGFIRFSSRRSPRLFVRLLARRTLMASPSSNCDVASVRCTTGVQDTHKTYVREVHYRWHPWHGQLVCVQAEARRSGTVLLRCVREEDSRLAALEIPQWMFDSGSCSVMKPESLARVSLSALLALRALLAPGAGVDSTVIEAQHLSSDSGGADVDGERPPGQTVYSPSSTAASAAGSLSADDPFVGPDDERTYSEERLPECAGGGCR